jgi:hypothetical protein
VRPNLSLNGVSFLLARTTVIALVAAVAAIVPATAFASELIDRNASNIQLAVNRKGEALLTYRARGRVRHVLVWGAINARHPTRGVPQVAFKIDYAGGWGKYRRQYWKTFRNACRPYDGPKLDWFVTACKTPNGSYWALQKWQKPLPDLGFTPWLPRQRAWWLKLSHWTGPLAQLEVWTDWVYSRRFHEIFGRATYRGMPVHGFGATRYGVATDNYGRLFYLDTYNSAYAPGWRRENSFLAHNPGGVFCYGFFPRNPYVGGYTYPPGTPRRPRGPGNGKYYRITFPGPGVTPDVMWQGPGLHDYDANNPADVAYERAMNAVYDGVMAGDRLCKHH